MELLSFRWICGLPPVSSTADVYRPYQVSAIILSYPLCPSYPPYLREHEAAAGRSILDCFRLQLSQIPLFSSNVLYCLEAFLGPTGETAVLPRHLVVSALFPLLGRSHDRPSVFPDSRNQLPWIHQPGDFFFLIPSLPNFPIRSVTVFCRASSMNSDSFADRDQRERSRSPRRRSRSPHRSRRSYSPRSRSRSRDDYRRSDRRSRSPMSGVTGAPGGYPGSGYGGRNSFSTYAPPRSAEDRVVAKEQMMQSVRDSSQQDRRVYVGNLSYDVKWHHLKDFMRQGEQGHVSVV